LRRDGLEAERENRLHPTREPRVSYVQECLPGEAPVVAATDYIRTLPDMIRPWVGGPYTALGTDGFGRSDWRWALRRFFEVDRHHVCVAALHSLGRREDAAAAIAKYEIDADSEAPWRR
jgi:pyruvate dehydrogenase E1 component